jgi:hypothetical protein
MAEMLGEFEKSLWLLLTMIEMLGEFE